MLISVGLPYIRMSPPSSRLSLVTSSAMSPSISVAFHSSGSCSVVEATSLGMLLIRRP